MIQDNKCLYIMIVYVMYYIHDMIFFKRRIIIFSYEYNKITFLKINLGSDVYKSKHFLFIYARNVLY